MVAAMKKIFTDFTNIASQIHALLESKPPLSKLERDIQKCFKRYGKSSEHHAILVSIRPDDNGTDVFFDPRAKVARNCEVDVRPLSKDYSLDSGIKLRRSGGYCVVMALDPSKPPQDQIPGWNTGTLSVPDSYLEKPLITVADPLKLLAVSPNKSGIDTADNVAYQIRQGRAAGTQTLRCHM